MKDWKFVVYTMIRVLIILFLCIVFGFIFAKSDLFFSQIIIFSLVILLSLELVRFVTKTNKELKKLLSAIKHHDFSASFSSQNLGKSYDDLSEIFSEIIKSFRNVKIEKEAQLQLLQVIIDQINIGVVAVRDQHQIVFINKRAEEVLDIPGLKSWNIDFPLIYKINEEVKAMKSHGKKLLELQIGDEMKQLAFHVNRTVFLEDDLLLMTFHDIRSEIEQKEIEAWYKLIRILTHEVMNSVTPLFSLTETMLMLLQDKGGKTKDATQITNEEISDIITSLKTIQGRSEGILEFVDAYRRLTNIPHPEFDELPLKELLTNIESLFAGELKQRGITMTSLMQNDQLSITADKHLMEQVLINLISNSMHALEQTKDPKIEIKIYSGKHHAVIEVADNGKGVELDKIDKIFIPFFSTREGGSGIGLSLSKQIIYLHHGRIKVKSSPGKGATFRIEI
jgi:two-component system nitrogen regulation sensor histidine kinase NtrY